MKPDTCPIHGKIPNGQSSPYSEFPADTVEGFSSTSTPFDGASSSPDRAASAAGYFFSCPASPVHFVLASLPSSTPAPTAGDEASASGSFEFDGAAPGDTMISADELFINGQIRPLKFPSHLLWLQTLELTPEGEDDDDGTSEAKEMAARAAEEECSGLQIPSSSIHRRTRSMSPLRSPRLQWQEDDDKEQEAEKELELGLDLKEAVAPIESAFSSTGNKNSRPWVFLKDLLYRSKSEGSGRGNGKEKKFWHSISFSPSSKSKPPLPPVSTPQVTTTAVSSTCSTPAAEEIKTKPLRRRANGLGRRRAASAAAPSAHERLYTTNRTQAEEMRRRTFLPYREGLLGCLGFTSRSYGVRTGLAKALNPVNST